MIKNLEKKIEYTKGFKELGLIIFANTLFFGTFLGIPLYLLFKSAVTNGTKHSEYSRILKEDGIVKGKYSTYLPYNIFYKTLHIPNDNDDHIIFKTDNREFIVDDRDLYNKFNINDKVNVSYKEITKEFFGDPDGDGKDSFYKKIEYEFLEANKK